MRLKLEEKINSMNLNFKRFYEEADTARKIVSEKLRCMKKKELELK